MLIDYLQIRYLAIIFVGDFNPAIIQPAWLAAKKLINQQEADNAKIDLIHPQLTRINLDWVFIEVSIDRFELRTSNESFFEIVRDLAQGIFHLLSETPIRALGINHNLHYAIPDEERYFQIGKRLGNLDFWSQDGLFSDPKMLRLDIIQQKRSDDLKGNYRIVIQPSNEITVNPFGVLLTINNHLDAEDTTNPDASLSQMLSTIWDSSSEMADKIPLKIWEHVMQ